MLPAMPSQRSYSSLYSFVHKTGFIMLLSMGFFLISCHKKQDHQHTFNENIHVFFGEDSYFPYITQSLEKSWMFYACSPSDRISASRSELIQNIEKSRNDEMKDPQNIKPMSANLFENSLSHLLYWMLSAYQKNTSLKGIQALELFDAKGILIGYSYDANVINNEPKRSVSDHDQEKLHSTTGVLKLKTDDFIKKDKSTVDEEINDTDSFDTEKYVLKTENRPFDYYLSDQELRELQDHFQKAGRDKQDYFYPKTEKKQVIILISAVDNAARRTILGYFRVTFEGIA